MHNDTVQCEIGEISAGHYASDNTSPTHNYSSLMGIERSGTDMHTHTVHSLAHRMHIV